MRMPRAEIPLPELLMFAVAIREREPDLYETVVRDIQSFRRERDGKEVKDFESLKAEWLSTLKKQKLVQTKSAIQS